MADEKTWHDVAEIILNSWPAGPGNKGWEREHLAGYVAELGERKLNPERAIIGLRQSTSGFIPAAGEVVALFQEAQGPPTAARIAAAEERMRVAAQAKRAARHLNAA